MAKDKSEILKKRALKLEEKKLKEAKKEAAKKLKAEKKQAKLEAKQAKAEKKAEAKALKAEKKAEAKALKAEKKAKKDAIKQAERDKKKAAKAEKKAKKLAEKAAAKAAKKAAKAPKKASADVVAPIPRKSKLSPKEQEAKAFKKEFMKQANYFKFLKRVGNSASKEFLKAKKELKKGNIAKVKAIIAKYTLMDVEQWSKLVDK